MIDNSDRTGDYDVLVFAVRNAVCRFQCPTLADAQSEITRIVERRESQGRVTTRATARQILGKSCNGLELGRVIDMKVKP